MMTVMSDLTGRNFGITTIGELTADDCASTLLPVANERLRDYDKISLLCYLGPECTGSTLGAAWSHTKFGLMHLADFEKFALVSDVSWVRMAIKIFAPLLRYPVRVFANHELDKAKQWVMES